MDWDSWVVGVELPECGALVEVEARTKKRALAAALENFPQAKGAKVILQSRRSRLTWLSICMLGGFVGAQVVVRLAGWLS